ncbi:hypothetical protein GCM10027275_23660 [Rhabdobacter roseus]|uniref:histidine kinase n=1 Tax=Rhabdobacter roseus TaxID=1655419 RepID=A0A840TJD4_9BACT|nr:PAS domain S-box protein [Rhabdobacter roseus]MBB5284306.1 PAS domain S-box-containing protein [Rhabdobacter roseus]
MNEKNTVGRSYTFLPAEGEMSALIQTFNWSETPLGALDSWPQSLRTTLSIVLSSRFPMMLWWGPELIQFYNDAFREILGSTGKHPKALGQRGEICWPETWATVKPLIEQVWSGKGATWSEDHLIPIYRNAHIEDVYWTFSHSPVIDEQGTVGGVLVVCHETTHKVLNLQKAEESEESIRFALNAAGIGTWDLDTIRRTVSWDERCRDLFGVGQDGDILYENVIQWIHADDQERVTRAVDQALSPELDGKYDIEFRTIGAGDGRLRWLRCKGNAYFNDQGIAYRFSGTAQDISQEVALREEQQRLLLLVENSTDYMGIANAEGYIVYINRAGRRLLGIPVDQPLPALTVPSFYSAAQAAAMQQEILPQLEIEGRWSGTIQLRHFTTHEEIPCHAEFVMIYDPTNGKPLGRGVTIRDLRPELMAREKLETSEERFRSFVLSSPTPVGVYIGCEMRVQIVNDAILKAWGKDASVVGKTYREALPELEGQPFFQLLDDVYRTGVSYEATEDRVDLRHDGEMRTFYYNFTYKALRDSNGEIYGVINTGTDVTDLVRAKHKLKESEENLREAVDLAELGTYEINLNTGVVHLSQRAREWAGFEPDEPIALRDLTSLFVDPTKMKRVLKEVLQLAPDTTTEIHYEMINSQTGQVSTFYSQARVVISEQNGALCLMGVSKDVTAQKELEQELEKQVRERTRALEQANYDLQRSNESLERFAYVASHDLQEPLRKIVSFGDMLKRKYAGELRDGVDLLERMQNAAGRMSVLIDDLLVFSRLTTQRQAFVQVPLGRVVREALHDLELRVQESRASIELGELPTVPGNVGQLRQLFQNLLSNALKFKLPEVPPTIRIHSQRIRAEEVPQELKITTDAGYLHKIEIADNGIGFDEKYLQRIFQVFQRLHGKSQYVGTGIGLAIVQKVAENHGGAVTARSQPGQGATFVVYLPE